MCGISGIINLNKRIIDIDLLNKMGEIVKHRGPDDMGVVLISSQSINNSPKLIEFRTPNELRKGTQHISNYDIGLGHRRLSIIDLSDKGHQPMSNEDGSLWIVHNGEIYNYLEIRRELVLRGYKFKSNTDTEVILNSYKEWGIDCLNKFNGMWSFAIWDNLNKSLLCSRDRFGIKPFYYFVDDNLFIFASEIKQILEYEKYHKKPNDKLIYDFFVIGLEDQTNETFFEGIYQLRGGEYAILDLTSKKLKIERFYDFRNYREINHAESDIYEHFKNLFFDSVKIRLRSDVPVGSCLSGGLDSSAVVCTISELQKNGGKSKQFETFTACWEHEKINERQYAEQIATHIGANGNYIFPNQEELQEDLSRMIWHQEEPFGSLSIFAQWSVMKAARKRGVPVLLDGQGGDEVFLGYERYYAWFLMDLLKQFKLRRFIEELVRGAENSKLSIMEMIQYYIYFNFNRVRALLLNKNAKKYMNADFIRNYNALTQLNNFKKARNISDLQMIEIRDMQLSHLLKYADRNSMAFSIETRLPFLDYRLVEFALSIPSETKIRNGWTKNIVRQGMKGVILESIRKRKSKIGFEVPQRKLLQSMIPEIKNTFKNSTTIKKYVEVKYLVNKIQQNEIGDPIVWKSLCLALWFRAFLG
jgi:asparagine synthase (glutamine-hydrolysing)